MLTDYTALEYTSYFSIVTQWPEYELSLSCIVVCIYEVHTNVTWEPRHDKTNKMSVHPAKTQITLGIRPVWSESSLSAWRKLGSLATH